MQVKFKEVFLVGKTTHPCEGMEAHNTQKWKCGFATVLALYTQVVEGGVLFKDVTLEGDFDAEEAESIAEDLLASAE